MQALTVVPGRKNSGRLDDVPEPPEADGPVVVSTRLVGICGTDLDILGGGYGWSPPGRDRSVLGHESLGEVQHAPAKSGVAAGDLVVGIVRRADPVPCSACAVQEWDMCRNGQYAERGIKARDGYASQRYRIHPEHLVTVDPKLGDLGVLLEPTSVVAKAWEQIDRISTRAAWSGKVALITGAGPIGLLAALLAVQRGYQTHVVDVVVDVVTDGPKPQLVSDPGAEYHSDGVARLADRGVRPDVVVECTGLGSLVWDVLVAVATDAIVCLTGISNSHRTQPADLSSLNKSMVPGNAVIFGSVNAARRHYEQGAKALAGADRSWLQRLVTRRVPIRKWQDAIVRRPDDVKVTLDLG